MCTESHFVSRVLESRNRNCKISLTILFGKREDKNSTHGALFSSRSRKEDLCVTADLLAELQNLFLEK